MDFQIEKAELRPLNPERHLTPALSPTSVAERETESSGVFRAFLEISMFSTERNPSGGNQKFSGQRMPRDKYSGMTREWCGQSPGALRKLVGVPAVMVLGIGLMIAGQLLLGLMLIVVAVAVAAVVLSATTARKALWISAAGVVCAVVLITCALSDEWTGKAVYHKRGKPDEPVTRESSPAHFRYAVNSLWMLAGISSVVAAGGFTVFLVAANADRKWKAGAAA